MTPADIKRLRLLARRDQTHAPAIEAMVPLFVAFKTGDVDAFARAATEVALKSFRAGYEDAINDMRDLMAKGYDTIDPLDGGRNDR